MASGIRLKRIRDLMRKRKSLTKLTGAIFCAKCLSCRKAVPGHTKCRRCIGQMVTSKKGTRERYAEAGLCTECGKNEPCPGLRYCRSCREKTLKRIRRWEIKQSATGAKRVQRSRIKRTLANLRSAG